MEAAKEHARNQEEDTGLAADEAEWANAGQFSHQLFKEVAQNWFVFDEPNLAYEIMDEGFHYTINGKDVFKENGVARRYIPEVYGLAIEERLRILREERVAAAASASAPPPPPIQSQQPQAETSRKGMRKAEEFASNREEDDDEDSIPISPLLKKSKTSHTSSVPTYSTLPSSSTPLVLQSEPNPNPTVSPTPPP